MTGRERLRELLDAVLDEQHETLAQMAGGVWTSPFHFTRLLSEGAGESPVAMRRRVALERAAWQIRQGTPVTDAAWAAGYESVEGFSRAFSRAFGHPPSRPAARHWLPSPNGIHFHPPASLWVHTTEQAMNPLTENLVEHDLDDTRALIELAKGMPERELNAVRLSGHTVTSWEGPEESIAAVLNAIVYTKEVWLAAIEGAPGIPARAKAVDPGALLDRHDASAARWLHTVRDIDRRGAWNDVLIDALCEPPESFVLSSVIAHVLTYSAHRRQLARHLLRNAGKRVDDGDPINWLRARLGQIAEEESG